MDEVTKNTVDFLKVIGDETRLMILELLRVNELTSSDFEEALGLKQSTVSLQLKNLLDANLITVEKKVNGEGKRMNYYSVKDKFIYKIISSIRSFIVNLQNPQTKQIARMNVADTLR